MQEQKCPKCGNVFSNSICCSKCGSVFLFNDDNQLEENAQKQTREDNYALANDIIASDPQNDFEAKRKEIIEDLLMQRKLREKEQKIKAEKLREEREKEEALKKAREQALKKAEEEALKKAEESRILCEKLKQEQIEIEKNEVNIEIENNEKIIENEKVEEIDKTEEIVETSENNSDLECTRHFDKKEFENSISNSDTKDDDITIENNNAENKNNFENTTEYSFEENINETSDIHEKIIQENNEINVLNLENETVSKDLQNTIKEDTLFIKALRKILIGLYSLTIIAMLLPFTKFVNISSVYKLTLIDFVVIVPIAFELIVSIMEKNFIRKYILGSLIGIIYLGVYIVINMSLTPDSLTDILYYTLFGGSLLISVVALIADRNNAFKKFCVWFDSISYIVLFINVFALIFLGLLFVVAPGFVEGILQTYIIILMCILASNIISCIFMIKHKNCGADLFMATSISWIILVVVAYNQMMNSIGYRTNFMYMNSIGTFYSIFIAACVVFPIILFIWLRMINLKEK